MRLKISIERAADLALCKRLNEAINKAITIKKLPGDFHRCLNAMASRLSYGDGSATDEDRSDANAFIIGIENLALRAVAPVVPIKRVFASQEPGQMKFKATDDMAKKLAYNACDAAGLNMPIEKFIVEESGPKAGIFIGNVGGVAVNLHLKKVGAEEWSIDEHLTDVEKHKWLQSYKTVTNLLNSVRGVRLGLRDADPAKIAEREAKEKKAADENTAALAKGRETAKAAERTPEQRAAAKANKTKEEAAAKAPVVDPDEKKSAPAAVPPQAASAGKGKHKNK